jgi:transposase-like protein
MVDFKGAHYPKGVIVHAVFFYVRHVVSYGTVAKFFFLKNFVLCTPTFRSLECQINQNSGHTKENSRKLDVQIRRAENKILVF